MSSILSNTTNVVIFIVMLGVLVFVHEFGHFFTAKRLKIPVLEFGFGFPPRALVFARSEGRIDIQGRSIVIPKKFALPQNLIVGSRVAYKTELQNGRETLTGLEVIDDESQGLIATSQVQNLDPGTEYSLNWIPIGGFVRLMGEEDPNVPGGFSTAKPSVRIPVLLAGVLMNFALAWLVFSTTAMIVPSYVSLQTTRITAVMPNSPAAIEGLKANDLIVAVNGIDVKNDYPTLSTMLRQNAGKNVMLTIVRNTKTLEPISIVPRANPPPGEGAVGIQLAGLAGPRILGVEPGSPAERAGVQPGDGLVFLADGKIPAKDEKEIADYVRTHPGFKVEWTLIRGGESIGPVVVQLPDSVTDSNANLGLKISATIFDAPFEGLRSIATVALETPKFIGRVLRGEIQENAFVGVIGMAQATNELAQRGGALTLFQWFGLLSLNLALVNLLPLPAIDGGRLVFVLLEIVRGGKRIDPQKEALVHLAGMIFLLGLMVVISFFDIQRLLAGKSIFP